MIFVPAGQATTASGLKISPIHLRRQSGDQHRYLMAERDAYTGVTALWNNTAHATREAVTVGDHENAQQLRHTYASEEEALEPNGNASNATPPTSPSPSPLATPRYSPTPRVVHWLETQNRRHAMGDNGSDAQPDGNQLLHRVEAGDPARKK